MRTPLIHIALLASIGVGTLLGPAFPAVAASSAALTIAQFEAQGFEVRTNRIGSAPIDECTVTSIGKAREQRRLERFGDDFVEVVFKRTITLTLDCSR